MKFDVEKVQYRLRLRRAQELSETLVPREVSLCLIQDYLMHYGYGKSLSALQQSLSETTTRSVSSTSPADASSASKIGVFPHLPSRNTPNVDVMQAELRESLGTDSKSHANGSSCGLGTSDLALLPSSLQEIFPDVPSPTSEPRTQQNAVSSPSKTDHFVSPVRPVGSDDARASSVSTRHSENK